MSIAKPFTFVSGTYAKSAEVNADFDTAYSQINTNISNIAKNASDITNLSNTKANLNGNASQVFNVADPTASSHAMNKQTFFNLTSNIKYFISGYIISVDSGSPNDTIIVSEGSCYDSEYQVMLTKNVSTTKHNTTQSANTTYYVYVIGNSAGSSVDILISTSSSNPGLPVGYSLYRQIGYYTTNSDSNIDIINYFGQSANSPSASSVVVETYVNGNDWYRLWSDGWCEQGGTITTVASSQVITLLKAYKDENYYAEIHARTSNNDTGGGGAGVAMICGASTYVYGQKTDSFRASTYNSAAYHHSWVAMGYIS